ncbi:MAG TPA: hypothetical protein VF493_13095 [Terriglobales bacterium]
MHLLTSAVQQQQQIAQIVLVTDCIAKNTTIAIAKTSSLAIIETLDGSDKKMMRIIFASPNQRTAGTELPLFCHSDERVLCATRNRYLRQKL